MVAAGCPAPQPEHLDVARLEAMLAAQDSATAVLEQWCGLRGIATPKVTATLIRADAAPVPHDLPALLGTGKAIGYRHVALACGGEVLSVAHNWYDRGLLTPEMNAALDATDTPFGKVAAPLAFRRTRLDSQRGGLEKGADGCPKGTVLAQRALLRLPDGRPLALLVECYTEANLRHAAR
jgi:chorismate-pyruvate lyase